MNKDQSGLGAIRRLIGPREPKPGFRVETTVELSESSVTAPVVDKQSGLGAEPPGGEVMAAAQASEPIALENDWIGSHCYLFDAKSFRSIETLQSRSLVEMTSSFLREGVTGFGCSPSIWFDALWYSKRVDQTGGALVNSFDSVRHFLSVGSELGLAPSAYFDYAFYVARYRAVRERLKQGLVANALEDYIYFGAGQGLSPNPWFEEKWYRSAYSDVEPSVRTSGYLSGFHHYLLVGRAELRNPGPRFSDQRYRDAHADVAEAVTRGEFQCGFDHWLLHGFGEGRDRGNEKVGSTSLNWAG